MIIVDDNTIKMPRRLTAENGAKRTMIGEFYQVETLLIGGDDVPDHVKIPIRWATIKEIYKRIVKAVEDGDIICD